MKLDKSKEFSTVHGHDKASFFQDGVYFDLEGNEVVLEVVVVEEKPEPEAHSYVVEDAPVEVVEELKEEEEMPVAEEVKKTGGRPKKVVKE